MTPAGGPKPTVRGYDFFECSSAMQKAIRRGDGKTACYFGLELYWSGFKKYVWKRLFIISVEDVAGDDMTSLLMSNWEAFMYVTQNKKTDRNDPRSCEGSLFIVKSILTMCKAAKCRDGDHALCLLYEEKRGIDDDEIQALLDDPDLLAMTDKKIPIPDYALDMHTRRGKLLGRGVMEFMKMETEGLGPVKQPGFFDDLEYDYVYGKPE